MFQKVKRIFALMLCLALAFSFTACGNKGGGSTSAEYYEDDMSKEVSLKWYIRMAEPKGADEVLVKVNEYLKEKINAKLDLVFVQPGDYDQKMQMAMAANEKFDLVWTAEWANKYENNILKGAFLELDELLKATPDLQKFYTDDIWDAVSVNGKIYGVPNNQVLYDQSGVWFIKDIVDKYNLPVEDIKSLDDMTAIYQTVKDNEPNLITLRAGQTVWFQEKMTSVGSTFLSITKDGTITDRIDETMPRYKVMRDWYERGFFPADVATMTDETSLIKAGKIFSRYNRQLPGASEKHRITNDYDVINVATGEPMIGRGSVQSTVTAVSATSENPIRALKLIELMQTDKYLANLMFYGIEGRDYEKDPDNPNVISRKSDSYYVSEFLVGNQFLGYVLDTYPENVWEETDKANKAAPVYPYLGFAFDPSPFECEITQMSAVNKEYSPILSNGLEVPEVAVPEYQSKMKTAGMEKVAAELEKQFNEWKKTQQ